MEGRRQGSPVTTYRTRLAERQAEVERLERRHAAFAWTRLALVALAGASLFAFRGAAAPVVTIPIVAFAGLAVAHARLLNRKDRAARAAAFYERGLARLEHRWHGRGQDGERFRDPAHLYADDLDLFGKGSLFELLATARTTGGEDLLAAWLKAPASPAVIRARQQAVGELAPRLDFHEDLAVIGPEVQRGVQSDALRAWAAAPSQLPETWPRLVLPVIAAITTALVIQYAVSGEQPALMLPWLVVHFLLARYFSRRVEHVAHGVERSERELEILAELMARIERETVTTPRLRQLQAMLRATGRPPADEVRRLARMVDFISSMHNPFFAIISALLMLGTQLAFAVERWRTRCGPNVPAWLDAVAEFEALSALGTYRAEHPADPFPEIVDGGDPVYEGEGLAHPLLPDDVAVANSVTLGGAHPHLLIVSGSNMSGKSTFLRTVGLNAVLAQAGAPVRATALRLTPLAIGATLRIQDSLQQGRSRFYAEITRISEIVAMAKSQTGGVLFLFDELLSGTNSHDRHQGAAGILSALIAMNAIGLVTTHDLALTAMADTIGGHAANVHFEDRFESGTLEFDYKLREGVVHSSNAIALMRSVGLNV